MSTENKRDREKMRLLTQSRSEDIDRRIAETRERLEYSRRFFEGLSDSERPTRDYVTQLVSSLEQKIDRLSREQDQLAPEDVKTAPGKGRIA